MTVVAKNEGIIYLENDFVKAIVGSYRDNHIDVEPTFIQYHVFAMVIIEAVVVVVVTVIVIVVVVVVIIIKITIITTTICSPYPNWTGE